MEVHLRGACNVSISKDRVVADDATHTFRNGVLEIEGAGNTNITFNRSGVLFGSMGYGCATVIGNGNFVSGNTVMMNGAKFEMRGDGLHLSGRIPRAIFVNGRALDMSAVTSAAPEPIPRVDFKIPAGEKITRILVTGSGTATVEKDALRPEQELTAEVVGSGDIIFERNRVDRLQANLMGSGDIRGKLVAQHAVLTLRGSGGIRKIHGVCSVRASLLGSGDLKVSANPNATVSKNCIGTGDLSVKRRAAPDSSDVKSESSRKRICTIKDE